MYNLEMNDNNLRILTGEINLKCYQNIKCSTLAIFSKESYRNNELSVCHTEKLQLPECNQVPKYRPYLKVVEGSLSKEEIIKEQNILTFVLFNPSHANQYTLDDTIENCAYVASIKGYIGFEILNLLNIRNPNIKNIIPNCKNNNYNCYRDIKDIIIFEKVVLAWGLNKNKYFKEMETSWNKFFKLFHKQDTKYYYLQKDSDEDIKTRHLGNQGWNCSKCKFQENFSDKNESRIQLKLINNDNRNVIIKIRKSGKIETTYI